MPTPLEVKLPTPRVGAGLVLQQTPFAVIAEPPSEITLPPLEAELVVILVIAVVGPGTGNVGADVVKVSSLPKTVTQPAGLVLYRFRYPLI
jgi:hypothetical protein